MDAHRLAQLLELPLLAQYQQRVQQELAATLTSAAPSLDGPLRDLAHSGGKRLRPLLVLAAALSTGKDLTNAVVAGGVAIELTHLATLVHDDIMDEAGLRWGKPTVVAAAGQNTAILTGDYLLAQSVARAATISGEAAELTATTIATLCEGQAQELADTYNKHRTIQAYLDVVHKKTAALTAAACHMGAVCAGLPPRQVKALVQYGEAFGMAFQLLDDLLDVVATTESLGKPVGNDLREGVYTLPILLALEGEAAPQVRRWLHGAVPEAATIVAALDAAGVFAQTLAYSMRYHAQAKQALTVLPQTGVVRGLAGLPDYYLDWALSKQTVIAKP